MYPEEDCHRSLDSSFVYTPNETPPNEEAQYGQHLLDRSPRNALSTPPNIDSGTWEKSVSSDSLTMPDTRPSLAQ